MINIKGLLSILCVMIFNALFFNLTTLKVISEPIDFDKEYRMIAADEGLTLEEFKQKSSDVYNESILNTLSSEEKRQFKNNVAARIENLFYELRLYILISYKLNLIKNGEYLRAVSDQIEDKLNYTRFIESYDNEFDSEFITNLMITEKK